MGVEQIKSLSAALRNPFRSYPLSLRLAGKYKIEMKKNYVDQPVFQLAKTEDKLCNIMYSDFLSDLCINVDKVTQFNAKRIAIIGHNSYEYIVWSESGKDAAKESEKNENSA